MKKTLIIIYCLFISFLIGTAMFAYRTFDGDIDNAYAKGMQYLKDQMTIKELGWQFANIPHPLRQGHPGQIELFISDKNGLPIQGAVVTMEVSRSTKLATILAPQVTESKAGQHLATITSPFYGNCQVDTRIIAQGKSIPYNFKIYVEEKR